jgi:O-antigen/teichoic acid export membrane protein
MTETSNGRDTDEAKVRSPIANASSLAAGRLVVAAMGWTGTVIIARTLSQEEFGQFTLVFSLLGIVSVVSELGTGRVALSGVLEDEDPATFAGAYILLRTLLGLVGYALAVIVVVAAGYPDVVIRTTLVAGLVIVLATPSHAYEIAFQVHLRLNRVAIASVFGQTAQLALTVAIAASGGTIVWFAVPAVVAELVILAIKLPLATRLMPFRYAIRRRMWAAIMREAVPLSIGTALATLYFRVDAVMLSKFDDFDAVAVYGVAYKFVDVIHFVSAAVTVSLLAVLVQAWPNRTDDFRAGFRLGAAFLGVLGGLILVEFALFAGPAIRTLYGSSYEEGALATQILITAEVISFFGALAFMALVATGRNRAYPWIAGFGLLVNVGLNLAVIPRWSYEGAAVTTVVTEVVVFTLLWSRARQLPGLFPLRLGYLLRVVPAAIVAAAAGLVSREFTPWPVAGGVVALVFVAIVDRLLAGVGGLRALLGAGLPMTTDRQGDHSAPSEG